VRTVIPLTRRATVTAGISAVLIAVAAAPALAADTGRQSAAGPSAPAVTATDNLFGVAAASRSSAWAVGTYRAGSAKRNLIEHWNGRSWTVVASPSPGGSHGGFLLAVAAVSPSSAWAVGGYSNGSEEKTLIERWNGRSWKQVPSPSPGGTHDSYLFGVTALSSSNAWAVGGYVNGTVEQTLIEHWNGRSWKRVASPNPGGAARVNDLESVTAISPSNAFAVGYYDVNGTSVARTLVEHWNGRAWKQQASPSPNGGGFNGFGAVAAVSSSSAWATGSYSTGVTDTLLLEHWNGKSWQRAAAQNPTSTGDFSDLAAVAAVSRSCAWIDGDYFNGGPAKTLIEHWNGKAWKQQASPSPGGTAGSYLHAVAAISTANAWAVGDYLSGPSSLTLIEHWNGKVWRHIPSPNR